MLIYGFESSVIIFSVVICLTFIHSLEAPRLGPKLDAPGFVFCSSCLVWFSLLSKEDNPFPPNNMRPQIDIYNAPNNLITPPLRNIKFRKSPIWCHPKAQCICAPQNGPVYHTSLFPPLMKMKLAGFKCEFYLNKTKLWTRGDSLVSLAAMDSQQEESVRTKMESLRMACEKEIPILQQNVDTFTASFQGDLASIRATVQETLRYQGPASRLTLCGLLDESICFLKILKFRV